MPLIILKLFGTTDEYDPPASHCYVNVTPELAGELCDLIEFVHGLRQKGGFLGAMYALETFANPAEPFDARVDAPDDEEEDPIKDSEFDQSLLDFMEEDETGSYFVCCEGAELKTDGELTRTGTDTTKISDDDVLFSFSCKHTCGTGETTELDYWQLAHWAGRATLPKPWRSFTAEEHAQWHASHPVPVRETI